MALSSRSFSPALGQGLRGQRGRGLGVAAELGEIAAIQRDQRRDVDQEAGRAGRARLERLIGRAGGRALSRVQQRLHASRWPLAAAMCACASSSRGRERTTSAGSDRQPPVDGGRLAADAVDHVEVLLDDPGRPEHLPGGGRVAGWRRRAARARSYQAAALRCSSATRPGCSAAGGRGAGRRTGGGSATSRAPRPAGSGTGRPLHRLQQLLAVGAAGDRVAQRAADSRSSTEVSSRNVRSCSLLPLEHLLGQVVQHVPVAAGERGHERRRHRRWPRSDSAASCKPAAQPSVRSASAATDASGRSAAGRVRSSSAASVGGEPQVGRAQLGQLAAGPQPGQRQRRVAAAGQHHAQCRRQVVEQELQRRVHLRRADQVVVVEDQQQASSGRRRTR